MKNQVLSIEQMQKLKELGVDTSRAGMVCLFQDDESNIYDWDEVVEECSEFGDCFQYFVKNDEGNQNMVYMSLLDAECGNYDHSYREDCTVFTLQDIIALLPKTFMDDINKFHLTISTVEGATIYIVGYVYDEDVSIDKKYFCNESIINAAYDMLIWIIENEYLKTK